MWAVRILPAGVAWVEVVDRAFELARGRVRQSGPDVTRTARRVPVAVPTGFGLGHGATFGEREGLVEDRRGNDYRSLMSENDSAFVPRESRMAGEPLHDDGEVGVRREEGFDSRAELD